jgi:hypothetical protein
MSTEEEQKTNSEANPEGAVDGAEAGKTPEQKALETVSREAYQALQSRADKAAADARRAREEADRAIEAAERSKRESVLASLPEADRAAAIKNFDLEARERRLQTSEREQEALAKTLTVKTLAMDNGLLPAQLTELEAIDDVNEMRARAAEMRAERLTIELEEVRKGGGGQREKSQEEQKAPKGMRGDPAGSGGGVSQGAYDPEKFKGTGKLADALRAQREAGAVKYEKIPTGR